MGGSTFSGTQYLLKILPFFWLVFMYFFILDSHLHYPEATPRSVILKTLPIFWLAFLVFQTHHTHADFISYQTSMRIGLLISMIGDACLVWRVQLFIPGLIFFLIAHLFYIKGLGLKPLGVRTGFFVTIAAIVMFSYLLPGISDSFMKFAAVSYCVVIFTMVWRSIVRWQQCPDVGSIAGTIGALLFLISDFIIAVDKWRMTVPFASAVIMITYYLAQLGIASSVILHGVSGNAFLGRSVHGKKKE